jgi:cytochrome c5
MKHWKHLVSSIFWLAALPMVAQTSSAPANSAGSAKESANAAPRAVHTTDGEEVFKQNCSRCHNAPESFPPSISGTIVRHMRVRASLSKEDEKALLRFLNP